MYYSAISSKGVTSVVMQAAGDDGLHEATTFQVNQCVHVCVKLTKDSVLLAKLSSGDMVTPEAKYHSKCLLAPYCRAEKGQVHQ